MSFDAVFDPHNWAVVPFHFWSLVFFAFGCIVGSFLNVCIYRMPLDLSVISPPSPGGKLARLDQALSLAASAPATRSKFPTYRLRSDRPSRHRSYDRLRAYPEPGARLRTKPVKWP